MADEHSSCTIVHKSANDPLMEVEIAIKTAEDIMREMTRLAGCEEASEGLGNTRRALRGTI